MVYDDDGGDDDDDDDDEYNHDHLSIVDSSPRSSPDEVKANIVDNVR